MQCQEECGWALVKCWMHLHFLLYQLFMACHLMPEFQLCCMQNLTQFQGIAAGLGFYPSDKVIHRVLMIRASLVIIFWKKIYIFGCLVKFHFHQLRSKTKWSVCPRIVKMDIHRIELWVHVFINSCGMCGNSECCILNGHQCSVLET